MRLKHTTMNCNGLPGIKSMEHLAKNIKRDQLNDIGDLVLFYEDDNGDLYPQRASDVSEVGTLLDTKTEQDMPLVGWLVVRDAQ